MASEDHDHLRVADNSSLRKLFAKLLKSSGAPADAQPERVVLSDLVVKTNRKGKRQTRALVITDQAVYNFKHKSYSSFKRRIPITSLAQVYRNDSSNEFVLHVHDDYDYRFESQRREEVVAVLASLHDALTGFKLAAVAMDACHIDSVLVTKQQARQRVAKMREAASKSSDAMRALHLSMARNASSGGAMRSMDQPSPHRAAKPGETAFAAPAAAAASSAATTASAAGAATPTTPTASSAPAATPSSAADVATVPGTAAAGAALEQAAAGRAQPDGPALAATRVVLGQYAAACSDEGVAARLKQAVEAEAPDVLKVRAARPRLCAPPQRALPLQAVCEVALSANQVKPLEAWLSTPPAKTLRAAQSLANFAVSFLVHPDFDLRAWAAKSLWVCMSTFAQAGLLDVRAAAP